MFIIDPENSVNFEAPAIVYTKTTISSLLPSMEELTTIVAYEAAIARCDAKVAKWQNLRAIYAEELEKLRK